MERIWSPPADETLEMRLERVLRDPVAIVASDPSWPMLFEQEKRRLTRLLADLGLTGRIEHFGSTAVPGLDMLRADPALATSYRDLKLDLARRFPGDRIAYTGGKTAFIARAMASRRA